MLQPARRKYRKEQKGRNTGVATRGANVSFGEFGLKATERGRITARQIEALDLIDEICNDPLIYLDMTLARGDMQFVNNYTVLHSRTDYEDWPEHDRRR